MILFQEKTQKYDHLVKQQSKNSTLCNALIFVTFIIGLAISIFLGLQNAKLILITFPITIIAVLVIYFFFGKKFEKNTQQIIKIFCEEYNISNKDYKIRCVSDNSDILKKITFNEINNDNGKNLICKLENDNLVFVAHDFLYIANEKSYGYNYIKYISTDFGKMIIPLDAIDYYLLKPNALCVLVVKHDDQLIKIDFNTDKVFDILIPQKEYYFSTAKKQDLD